ncbi:MAG: hypothetical protein H6500_04590 [Candidatus Woesearchaeota archaeon]|nr:MAG: hypothetical protein H6500_04590 [Candidatus Woesearchaeota archaeon]
MTPSIFFLKTEKTRSYEQIKAAYPDLAVFDAETGKIKLLANSGSTENDDWKTIGQKIQELVTDGFSFENGLNFHLSRDFDTVDFSKISEKLNRVDLEKSVDNTLIFRSNDNGPEVQITFVQEGGIN